MFYHCASTAEHFKTTWEIPPVLLKLGMHIQMTYYNIWVPPLVYHRFFLSPSAIGGIQTLDIRFVSWVLKHYATREQPTP